MALNEPVLSGPEAGRTVTYGGGSSAELKLAGEQSGGDWAVVEWRVRAGDEPPIHTHTREDEAIYESNSVVQVTDPSGLTLYLGGPEWLKARAAEMNLVEGARCSETVNGTNGVGTALATDHPVQVFAFEHFSQHHREWVCSGAPIHDPVSGRLVGSIDLSSPWRIAHPRSLELVTTAATTTERCLLDSRRDQDARLRRRYSDLMTRSTDLLVARDGYLLEGDVPRHRTALDVPRDGGEIVLHDGSMAVAEPLGRGEAYLVRRPGSRGAKTARVKSLERAERRARELAIEQAALRQITMLVARESSAERLFAVATEQVARLFDVPHVRLVRYEPDGSVVVGGFSESDHGPFPIGSRLPLDSAGAIAAVRQTGRAARVDDYAHLPGETAAVARRAGMRSAVASPIVIERRLWGAMVVLTPRHEPLPEDTEARLTDFTELVATAIVNAESQEARAVLTDEQAALRRVATLVAQGVPSGALFSSVCDEVEALAGAQASAVVRFETDGTVTVMGDHADLHPVGARVKPDPDSVVAEVHRTGRAARFDTDDPAAPGMPGAVRAERVRSALASPIVVAGEPWGAITAVSREHAFAAGMERRLADFTELVATAISSLHARAELAASRARIAAAADDERRRVVRDLHDGAQQRLVHTVITLRLAQRGVSLLRLLECLVHERLGRCAVVLDCLARELECHDRVHQPLLGSVVQVADDPPALVVGRCGDACARGGDLSARLKVGDRGRHQLREVGEPALRPGQERALA